MIHRMAAVALLLVVTGLSQAAPPPAARPVDAGQQVDLVLEDQFGRRQDVAAYRGDILVLIYSDRKGNDASKELGEKLYTLFHPTAVGQPVDKARSAPVAPLAGVPAGQRSPDVHFVPVAVIGQVPNVVKDLVRSQIKKGAPDVAVWLDFTGVMGDRYGLKASQPNLIVIDGSGRLRMKINGAPDMASNEKLLQMIQNLRAEAAGLSK